MCPASLVRETCCWSPGSSRKVPWPPQPGSPSLLKEQEQEPGGTPALRGPCRLTSWAKAQADPRALHSPRQAPPCRSSILFLPSARKPWDPTCRPQHRRELLAVAAFPPSEKVAMPSAPWRLKGREGHGDHRESWWDTGHRSHLLPRAGRVSTAQKPAGIYPPGERAAQSPGDRGPCFQETVTLFLPAENPRVHRPLCVHTHSWAYRNCCLASRVSWPVSPECAEFLDGRGWSLGLMKASVEAGAGAWTDHTPACTAPLPGAALGRLRSKASAKASPLDIRTSGDATAEPVSSQQGGKQDRQP